MQVEDFINECKKRIISIEGNNLLKGENIHCVWFNILEENYKGIFIILPLNGIYYECAYNSNDNELYINTYNKDENTICISLEEEINLEEEN